MANKHRPPVPASLQAVAEAFENLFVFDEDQTLVIRSGQVSKAVCAYLGIPWTYPTAQVVRAVATAAGARQARLCTSVYIGLRPKGITREQALEQSREFRKTKQLQKSSQPAVAAAREALRIAREKAKSDE